MQPARVQFDKFLKKLSGMPLQDRGEEIGLGALPNGLATLHDWSLDLDEKKWKPWNNLVPEYEPPRDGKFSSIVVPTSDTVRSTWLLDSVAAIKGAVLFVGDSGTAKTTVVTSYLQSRDPDTTSLLTVNMSSRTSSKDVQIAIEDVLEKRTKDTFGPPAGKRLMMFIDDLNMPTVDTYGTQQPVALLKLLIDKGFLYDRGKDLSIKYMKDMQFIGAMVPARCPYGVDPRFMRLFSVFNITFPPEESIRRIYSTILETFFSQGAFDKSMQGSDLASRCTNVMMDVFNAVVAALPPTPAKFHYIFNLRDLGRITEGVMQATPDKFAGVASIVRLERHEIMRILNDRMVGDDDKAFLAEKVEAALSAHFSGEASAALADPVLFGDFLQYHVVEEEKSTGSGDTMRLYEDLANHAAIKPILDECVEKYNLVNKAMNLVLFDDCLDHLVRVHRLMRLPRGNALLVGVGGSGKQSITRLAAYTANCDVFSVTLTRGYNEALFRDDLKSLYAMIVDKPVAFLFTDNRALTHRPLALPRQPPSPGSTDPPHLCSRLPLQTWRTKASSS
jgi:dynein heavy chain